MLASARRLASALAILAGCSASTGASSSPVPAASRASAAPVPDGTAEARGAPAVSDRSPGAAGAGTDLAERGRGRDAAEGEWLRNDSPPAEVPEGELLPKALLRANVRTTPQTVVVRVTAARIDDPYPGGGYVNHVYRAVVLETIEGEALDEIEYSVMAERDISLRLPAYPLIVSLCGSSGAGFYVPDNGYQLGAAAGHLRAARRAARRTRGSAASVDSACQ